MSTQEGSQDVHDLIKAVELMLPYFETSGGATEENVAWVEKVLAEAKMPKCPKCGGIMQGRSKSGYDRHGQEQEADWDECVKCGYTV